MHELTPDRICCPYCGKLAPKHTEIIYNPGKTLEDQKAWRYQGNQMIVSVRYSFWNEKLGAESDTPEYIWKVGVWDGETYRFGASHPFCNGDHAHAFAMAAYRAGYRIKRAASAPETV
jgi:hypothetical protein